MVKPGRLLGIALASVFLSVGISVASEPATPPAPVGPPGETQPATAAPPVPPEAAPLAASAEEDDANEIVCKKEQPAVGSHVRGAKICKTRRQWRGERLGQIPHLPDGTINPPGAGAVSDGARQPLGS